VAAEIGAAMAAGQAAGGLAFAGGLAHGGPVTAGQSFLVGERGPELFIPSERGRIEPNGGGGGMRPIIVNVNVTTQDAASFRRSSAQIAETIGRSMESVQRRNG
jgi:phage-related minor tail protein